MVACTDTVLLILMGQEPLEGHTQYLLGKNLWTNKQRDKNQNKITTKNRTVLTLNPQNQK